jgi:magnesium-transporting ATPase (P-type)
MKIKIFMSKFRNYIQSLDKKKLFYFKVFAYISWLMNFFYRKNMYENGYYFYFFFFSIILIIILGIIMMLRLVYQLEGPTRSPFHLLKYSYYFIILCVTVAPFLYLWGMRDVISHLKW